MFFNAFLIEHNKIFKRALPWIALGIMAALILLLDGVNFVMLQMNQASEMVTPEMIAEIEQSILWPSGLFNALGLAAGAGFGGFIIIILVGTVTAQEYTWGTLQQWLGRGVPRPTFLAAKFAALLLPIFLLVLTPLLVGGALTALITVQQTGGLNAEQVEWGTLALRTLYTAYTLLPYAGLTFLLAVVTRSTVAAVGGGIAYALLLEGFLLQLAGFFSPALARLALYLPAGLSQSLLNSAPAMQVSVNGASGTGIELLDPSVAAVGIAVYALLFLGAAMFIFRRQDLGG